MIDENRIINLVRALNPEKALINLRKRRKSFTHKNILGQGPFTFVHKMRGFQKEWGMILFPSRHVISLLLVDLTIGKSVEELNKKRMSADYLIFFFVILRLHQ